MDEFSSQKSTPDLNDPAIVEIALMLVREATDPAYRNSTLIEGLSYTLAMRVIKALKGRDAADITPAAKISDERIQRVLAYIEEHIAESSLSIEELAAVAFVSPHQLGRLFKSATGRTPHQFVLMQRISLAKLMLLKDDTTMSEIAFQCGFANQPHFTTRFRDIAGETPSKFRARMTGDGSSQF